MRVDLEDKVALVTGAARGIGRAIADQFCENGAMVIYADLGFEGAADLVDPGASPLVMDVTQPEAVAAAAAYVKERFGELDILVNNAGVNTLEHRVPIDQFPESEWDRLLQVDLTGVYRTSKAFAPLLLRDRQPPSADRGPTTADRRPAADTHPSTHTLTHPHTYTPPHKAPGRIINIASVAGLVPLRLQCAFVAAKAGVVNLTRAMALELGPRGVLVNCIAPGSILTPGTEALFYGEEGKYRESAQALLAHIPLGRPGSVDEVASAALFLVSPESSYINGAVLTVDGGWTAGYMREF